MSNESHIELLSNRLVESFLQTIELLSTILGAEERYYTGSHSRFISEKAEEVARYLHLPESEIFEIKTAALLHDIGKIGLPDFILSKFPTEMSPEEFSLYARHCEFGREVLMCHSGFSSIATIVHQHHERLDGSGFPQHLRGDDIHRGALIIGVIDVYHNAMYRQAKDRYQMRGTGGVTTTMHNVLDGTQARYDQVLTHLQRKAGTLYRPDIVEAFSAVMEINRKKLGDKVVKRLTVNQLKPGMTLAENHYTSYGMLVAARDEVLTEKMIASLIRFAEMGEVPIKVLVID